MTNIKHPRKRLRARSTKRWQRLVANEQRAREHHEKMVTAINFTDWADYKRKWGSVNHICWTLYSMANAVQRHTELALFYAIQIGEDPRNDTEDGNT